MAAYTPEQARELLAARVRRVRNIRRGIVAGALSAFALAWGVIAFTGPMGTQAASVSSSSGTTTSSPADSASDGWSQPSSDTWSSGGQSTDQGGVTTAQS